MTLFSDIVLINYRQTVAARRAMRRTCGPYHLRPQDAVKRSEGFYCASSGLAVDPHGSPFDLRLEWANDLLPSYSRNARISGYFCDLDGAGDTLKPIVARLPHGRGYLAGWTMGAGMCATVDRSTIWDNETDAANSAHDLASYDAENEQHRAYLEREAEKGDVYCSGPVPTACATCNEYKCGRFPREVDQ